MSHKVIAVVGATGNQGSGVVRALLETTDFSVRAISTNPASAHAQALLRRHPKAVQSGRLTLVQGDLADQASMEKALEGAYGLFAAFALMSSEAKEGEEPVEVTLGKSLVDAAKAVGIEHFVYSSLPNIREASKGRFLNVAHFDSKSIVERYAMEKLKGTTAVLPGSFYSNLDTPLYCVREEDGTAVFRGCFEPSTALVWVDDRYDVGNFTAAIFNKGLSTTAGKRYPVTTEPISMAGLAEEYHRVSGEKTKFAPLPRDKALDMVAQFMGKGLVQDLGAMFEWLDNMPADKICCGTMEKKDDTSYEDLGVKASTLQQFMERTGWRVGAP
ncbi:hypothetical protein JCM21900_003870 [Sporobolomyces salmonicolor]